MDTMTLLSQTVCLSFLAFWLLSGVRDNIRHPTLNETFTAEVMEMVRMQADYPDAFAHVSHRQVTNRTLQKIAFRLVVIWEILTAMVLLFGTALLLLALIGVVEVSTAKAFAIGGALMFTAVWAMFLIVGNHFCYWFCHEGAQNTHFQMTFWGLGTLIFLTVG